MEDAGQDLEQRGLATAARADHADELGCADLKIDVRERVDRAAVLGLVGLLEAADADQGFTPQLRLAVGTVRPFPRGCSERPDHVHQSESASLIRTYRPWRSPGPPRRQRRSPW